MRVGSYFRSPKKELGISFSSHPPATCPQIAIKSARCLLVYCYRGTHLPMLCSWPTARAVRLDCARQLAVQLWPDGEASGGRGGRRVGVGAAAATTAVLLRTAVVAAPWTCRAVCAGWPAGWCQPPAAAVIKGGWRRRPVYGGRIARLVAWSVGTMGDSGVCSGLRPVSCRCAAVCPLALLS